MSFKKIDRVKQFVRERPRDSLDTTLEGKNKKIKKILTFSTPRDSRHNEHSLCYPRRIT